ncbi:MAG: hypothetical protein AAB933_03400 [Patescibacteria group bacterium]
MDERTKKAIKLFQQVTTKASEENWKYVVLSGFAIDSYLGYISRNHKDVDFIVDKKNIEAVRSFLEKEGHSVYESKKYGNDLLRIDPIDKETTRAAHCDIHISFFDDKSKEVVISMLGKEIRFKGDYSDISIEKEFLGVKAKVLTPSLLLEEKKGWTEKIGLSGKEEINNLENIKIQKIISMSLPS